MKFSEWYEMDRFILRSQRERAEAAWNASALVEQESKEIESSWPRDDQISIKPTETSPRGSDYDWE